jgi:hypothetical protein
VVLLEHDIVNGHLPVIALPFCDEVTVLARKGGVDFPDELGTREGAIGVGNVVVHTLELV